MVYPLIHFSKAKENLHAYQASATNHHSQPCRSLAPRKSLSDEILIIHGNFKRTIRHLELTIKYRGFMDFLTSSRVLRLFNLGHHRSLDFQFLSLQLI